MKSGFLKIIWATLFFLGKKDIIMVFDREIFKKIFLFFDNFSTHGKKNFIKKGGHYVKIFEKEGNF